MYNWISVGFTVVTIVVTFIKLAYLLHAGNGTPPNGNPWGDFTILAVALFMIFLRLKMMQDDYLYFDDIKNGLYDSKPKVKWSWLYLGVTSWLLWFPAIWYLGQWGMYGCFMVISILISTVWAWLDSLNIPSESARPKEWDKYGKWRWIVQFYWLFANFGYFVALLIIWLVHEEVPGQQRFLVGIALVVILTIDWLLSFLLHLPKHTRATPLAPPAQPAPKREEWWPQVLWRSVCENPKLVIASCGLMLLTFGTLFSWPNTSVSAGLAGFAVLLVDLYILWVLFNGSVRSDARRHNLDKVTFKDWNEKWLPIRTAGLLMVGCFFFTVVFGFASIYRAICLDELVARQVEMAQPKSGAELTKINFNVPLTNIEEAIYFSTYATVGFGDISPQSKKAKRVVALEILSSLLLMVGVVSFLISRITDFGSEKTDEEKQKTVEEALNTEGVTIDDNAPSQTLHPDTKQKVVEVMKKLMD